MELMHLNNKYIYLKQSTFPSSIGLSLIWTTGPGWDLDDLKEKKWRFFFFSTKNCNTTTDSLQQK